RAYKPVIKSRCSRVSTPRFMRRGCWSGKRLLKDFLSSEDLLELDFFRPETRVRKREDTGSSFVRPRRCSRQGCGSGWSRRRVHPSHRGLGMAVTEQLRPSHTHRHRGRKRITKARG